MNGHRISERSSFDFAMASPRFYSFLFVFIYFFCVGVGVGVGVASKRIQLEDNPYKCESNGWAIHPDGIVEKMCICCLS